MLHWPPWCWFWQPLPSFLLSNFHMYLFCGCELLCFHGISNILLDTYLLHIAPFLYLIYLLWFFCPHFCWFQSHVWWGLQWFWYEWETVLSGPYLFWFITFAAIDWVTTSLLEESTRDKFSSSEAKSSCISAAWLAFWNPVCDSFNCCCYWKSLYSRIKNVLKFSHVLSAIGLRRQYLHTYV